MEKRFSDITGQAKFVWYKFPFFPNVGQHEKKWILNPEWLTINACSDDKCLGCYNWPNNTKAEEKKKEKNIYKKSPLKQSYYFRNITWYGGGWVAKTVNKKKFKKKFSRKSYWRHILEP